jgi:hypothetical protein
LTSVVSGFSGRYTIAGGQFSLDERLVFIKNVLITGE